MYKARRQRRYNKFIEAGFLPFEAVGLSRIPTTTMPVYMRNMIRDRVKAMAEAQKRGISKQQFVDDIKKEYRDKGCISKTVGGNISYKSVYKLLRSYEDAFRLKYPDYESPWEKRRGQFGKSIDKATRRAKADSKKFLETLYRELEKAKEHGNQQQIDIIQGHINRLESWQ